MAMHHAHSKPQALRRETALLIPVWPPARKWLCTMLIASRKPYDGRRPCWYLHFPIKRQSLVIIYRWKAHEYYIIMNNQSKLRWKAPEYLVGGWVSKSLWIIIFKETVCSLWKLSSYWEGWAHGFMEALGSGWPWPCDLKLTNQRKTPHGRPWLYMAWKFQGHMVDNNN